MMVLLIVPILSGMLIPAMNMMIDSRHHVAHYTSDKSSTNNNLSEDEDQNNWNVSVSWSGLFGVAKEIFDETAYNSTVYWWLICYAFGDDDECLNYFDEADNLLKRDGWFLAFDKEYEIIKRWGVTIVPRWTFQASWDYDARDDMIPFIGWGSKCF